MYYAKVDIIDAPDLKPVLPTRDRVIENDAWKIVCAASERAVFEAIAAQSDHLLSYNDFKRALSLGVEMAPPKAVPLRGYSVHTRNDSQSYGPGSKVSVGLDCSEKKAPANFVRFPELETPYAVPLARSISDADLPFTLVDGVHAFEGYAAYDTIPIAEAGFEATVGGKVLSFELDRISDEELKSITEVSPLVVNRYALVDSLVVILKVPGLDPLRFPIEAIAQDDDYRGEDVTAIVDRNASVDGVVSAIWDATWYDDDDDDSDAGDIGARLLTQEVRRALLPTAQARAINIRGVVVEYLSSYLAGCAGEPSVASLASKMEYAAR